MRLMTTMENTLREKKLTRFSFATRDPSSPIEMLLTAALFGFAASYNLTRYVYF